MHGNRNIRKWATATALLLMATALSASAAEDGESGAAVTGAAQPVNLLEASQLARDALGGAIIKAELTRFEGKDAYLVRLLEEGRIRDVLIDAASGRMLSPMQAESAE